VRIVSEVPDIAESELLRKRYMRYLIASVVLVVLALFITFIAMIMRSIWMLVLALSILVAAFGLMFSGATLRVEYKAMKEGGWKKLLRPNNPVIKL